MKKKSDSEDVLFRWLGAKSWLIPVVQEELKGFTPRRIVSPFAGTLALERALRTPAQPLVFAEAAKGPGCLWSTLLNGDTAQLAAELRELETSYNNGDDDARRVMYYERRDEFNSTKSRLRAAALFLLLNRAGFNALYRVNSAGLLNVPWGQRNTVKLPTSAALRRAAKEVGGAAMYRDWRWAMAAATQEDLVYVDPPYEGAFAGYTPGGFSTEVLDDLVEACRKCARRGARVLMSNSLAAAPVLSAAGARLLRVSATTTVSRSGKSRGATTELLAVFA